MDFEIETASDTSAMVRKFITTNFGHCVKHLYPSMRDDLNERNCLVCTGTCAPKGDPDMCVAGVPCKPYSLQRAKRFNTGSVKNHMSFSTMFVDWIEWLDRYDPKTGILENVMGLDQPEDRFSTITPLDLLLEDGIRYAIFLFRVTQLVDLFQGFECDLLFRSNTH